ncbi:MAG: 4Fe-4S dicluster domain-containing protein [Spirochaetia bacterium]|nr:4Fe-4S dicluster domain-containing protein [Spirochaetia bacterium]
MKKNNMSKKTGNKAINRKSFIGKTAAGLGALAIPFKKAEASFFDTFFQNHYVEMSKEEVKSVIDRMEKEYSEKYGKKVTIDTTAPLPGVKFGYGLDLSRCVGCRRCVYACVDENNQSRDPQIHYISVVRMKKNEKGVTDLENGTKYYEPEKVPEEGFMYVPIACMQCENSPCTKACPTQATWKEKDGVVAIDYDYCIGCRFCMAACPYGARKMNWGNPYLPADEVNPNMHYLGNRPRHKGCVEKCTWCLQRTRKGLYPACHQVCPVGARKFGNMLDPNSEIRYCLDNKRVFRLKEELNTKPTFFYFFSS